MRDRRPVEVRRRWEATRRSGKSMVSISPVTAIWFRAGRVSFYGAAIGGNPDGAKRGSGEVRGGGAEVMDRETDFINHNNFGEVKGGSRCVADRDDGGGEQGGGGN